MIRRPPRSTLSSSSAASDVYKRQYQRRVRGLLSATMALHGTSKRINNPSQPADGHILNSAKFYDFAPASCSCYSCCVPDMVRERQYAWVSNNRFESNTPYVLCGPCTCSELCLTDNVTTIYYDQQPFRSGLSCGCCPPMTCCGPPVIFVGNAKCCFCIDTTDLCGWTLKAAPCSVCNLKCCLCCGGPCYESCSFPLMRGLKDPHKFMDSFQLAVKEYQDKAQLPVDQRATFQIVYEGIVNDNNQTVMAPPTANQA
eukprot:TRINITY_DN4218_c0_g1_i1.p1 TRINITY_DN4218_c0_g1~~TRINITY_DN4218_c0_g1_i1.p1  ORF type:complete len:256 (-),score=64.00 TRINITY_DN4218_c0_g1_i1:247-1014(-)